MSDQIATTGTATEPVSLTLQLDANIYEAFVKKAQQANMEVGPFLSQTLAIVLGCRVFNEQYAASPVVFAKNPKGGCDAC